MTDEQLSAIEQRAAAAFINAARNDVPALIAEVRRLRDLVAELEEMKVVAARVDQSWRRNYCDCVNERDAAEDEAKKLRANIQRIGRERDQMIAANVELQVRLSAYEGRKNSLPTPRPEPIDGQVLH